MKNLFLLFFLIGFASLNAQIFTLTRGVIRPDLNQGASVNLHFNQPVKLKCITWYAPDGTVLWGLDIFPRAYTPTVYEPGEYCVDVGYYNDQMEICVASGCIYLPSCEELEGANGTTILSCQYPKDEDPPLALTSGSGASIKSVSPNPFTNSISVEIENPDTAQSAILRLATARGLIVLTEELSLEKGLNTFSYTFSNELSNGYYILKIVDSEGNTDSSQLVKSE